MRTPALPGSSDGQIPGRPPFVGTVAFDVKAKSVCEGCFVFDVAEIERLILFDEIFRITTFLACLGSGQPRSQLVVPGGGPRPRAG